MLIIIYFGKPRDGSTGRQTLMDKGVTKIAFVKAIKQIWEQASFVKKKTSMDVWYLASHYITGIIDEELLTMKIITHGWIFTITPSSREFLREELLYESLYS